MKQNQASLSSKQYAVPFILITSLFFMWGFARAILDVLNKHFQNALDISITQSALIQVTTYLGYFLMAIPAGLFINRQGYRRGVVSGLLLFGLGSLAFIPCSMLHVLRLSRGAVHHRLRTCVPRDLSQSVRNGAWSEGDSHVAS